MPVKSTISSLTDEISKIMEGYGDFIYKSTEEGLDAAQKILVDNLKSSSPHGDTGDYQKGWKSSGKKYKLFRVVGNTKTVTGKKRKKKNSGTVKDVPLSNVLEYSSKSNYQGLIKKTYNDSTSAMARAVVDKIKGA